MLKTKGPGHLMGEAVHSGDSQGPRTLRHSLHSLQAQTLSGKSGLRSADWCPEVLPPENTRSSAVQDHDRLNGCCYLLWGTATKWRQPCSHRMLFTGISSSLERGLLIPDLECHFQKLRPFPEAADHFFTTAWGQSPTLQQRVSSECSCG